MQIVLKAVVGLAVLMLATAAHADVIKGQVVTADGRPVSGADVAPFWQFDNHEITPYFGVTTDEEGGFTLDWDFSIPQVILAMNADRTLGGLVIVQPPSDEGGTTVEAGVITLVPMVDLKGGFYCDAFESRPDWSNVYMSVPPGIRLRIGSCPSDDAEFWFEHIGQNEAARFIGLSTRRMQGLRREGTGPKFVRISGRCVRYRRFDLAQWAESRLRTSTKDPGSHG